jgi:predicted RNase H-like nuclease (RuvC/YqgF family)
MTSEDSKQFKDFETRVRQLMLAYVGLKKENDELYSMVDGKDATIAELKAENERLRQQYANLKIAKMIDISDADQHNADRRLMRLLREVDKCIALLTV